MRILKITLITLVLCSISVLSLSCASDSDSAVSQNQVITVQRGDLTIDIAAAGNLALSFKEDLAFEMSGTVEEVLVEEGDSVKEGQVLARLDTSEWDKELTTLELNLLQAEINLENAEIALEKAEEPYSKDEIKSARAAVNSAEASLEYAEWQMDEAEDPGDVKRYKSEVIRAEESLRSAEAKLEAMLDDPDPREINIKELQVKLAEMGLEDAEEALEEALGASPEITAPFDGFITSVNVSGGDEVKKGTVAVTLADPNKFEADILVNEMDFLQVKLGGEARVQVDAVPGLSLSAKVSHISPTAVIQSGVVNYKVKVEVQSLEEAMQEQQEAMQKAMQERQQTEQAGQPEGQQRQMPTMVPEDFQLREGMTITLSIIVEESSDVLLVPIQAIISQGREPLVQVLKDGVIEERSITVGISNWQYTEVTSGLSEGEQVVILQGTTTPTTSQQGQGQPGGIMPIPGMPRMPR